MFVTCLLPSSGANSIILAIGGYFCDLPPVAFHSPTLLAVFFSPGFEFSRQKLRYIANALNEPKREEVAYRAATLATQSVPGCTCCGMNSGKCP